MEPEKGVQSYLDEGADVNGRDKNGRTALMLAVADVNWKVVTALLDMGADINAKNNDEVTVLMMAVRCCGCTYATGLTKLLLERGADVNAKDRHGRTALMRVLEPRLSQTGGYDGQRRYRYGSSDELDHFRDPYRDPCPHVVQLLLEKGADVNARDEYGRTALTYVLEPKIEIEADEVAISESERTGFTLKIKNGTLKVKRKPPIEIVELLKARGAKE